MDQAAGKSFHGDKAHPRIFTCFHYFQIRICRQIGKRELQRFVKTGIYRLLRHCDPMVCNADMPDLPLLFRLQRCVIQS